jgi:predicted O-methyltransferase YrrM
MDAIERVRDAIFQSNGHIQDIDFGAGYPANPYSDVEQRTGVVTTMPVSALIGFSSTRPWVNLLFQVIRVTQPRAALEMGTCIGISGSYLASAMRLNEKGDLWTIDGSPEVAEIARQTFATLGLTDYVTSIIGRFDKTLAPTLTNGPFDFAFVDGHHDGDATVHFHQLKPHLASSCIVAFDDIDSYTSMKQAWKVIASDPDVKDSSQVGRFGFVVV